MKLIMHGYYFSVYPAGSKVMSRADPFTGEAPIGFRRYDEDKNGKNTQHPPHPWIMSRLPFFQLYYCVGSSGCGRHPRSRARPETYART